jgi:AcrR family transcriptional regulator
MAKSYHHGDLRRALLDAALNLLRQQGLEALSLRAVARAARVSQTAPYRHFEDRRALLAAVAQGAYQRLGDEIERAVGDGERRPQALRRGMVAYVRFAHAHPAEYRLMFGPELTLGGEVFPSQDLVELDATALSVFTLLQGGIVRLQKAGALGPGDADRMAITAWATLHGLVMLSLDGRTEVTGLSVDELADGAVGLLLKGMGERS